MRTSAESAYLNGDGASGGVLPGSPAVLRLAAHSLLPASEPCDFSSGDVNLVKY